ncbi:unnamed protein product [Amoebophrya sp. A120]|nr:unnamed protein product [Amoebophrya sp. A120]|eukprot:GSA120T00020237001.1
MTLLLRSSGSWAKRCTYQRNVGVLALLAGCSCGALLADAVHVAPRSASLLASENNNVAAVERQNIFYQNQGLDWQYGSCHDLRVDHQSPVNFDARWTTNSYPTERIQNFTIHYPVLEPKLALNWTGSELEVLLPPSYTGQLQWNGEIYKPVKIIFRAKSEHTLNGRRFPLEAQVLHESVLPPVVPGVRPSREAASADGSVSDRVVPPKIKTASLVVFFDSAADVDEAAAFTAKDSSATDYDNEFQKLLANFPLPQQFPNVVRQTDGNFDLLSGFKLDNTTYLQYVGSGTSPTDEQVVILDPRNASNNTIVNTACSSDRLWFVQREGPVLVANYQIQNLANTIRYLNGKHDNYRALMPFGLHRRVHVLRASTEYQATPSENARNYEMMPWGKNPRTDAEVRAIKAAQNAKKFAKKVTKYIKDVKQAHYEAAKAYQDAIVEATSL